MKLRWLWMALAVLLTLAALGGIATWRAGQVVDDEERAARYTERRCLGDYPPDAVPPEVRDRCVAPYRAHSMKVDREWLSYIFAEMPIALLWAAGFWLLFGIAFFGIRYLRGDADEPEPDA
ncbi:MAG: hypothetical protein QOD42_396 [Sphingomonadales bacterium]|jgi:hypothetical protein|nr:hypothetical protein [Sphingomonadales bacterium]